MLSLLDFVFGTCFSRCSFWPCPGVPGIRNCWELTRGAREAKARFRVVRNLFLLKLTLPETDIAPENGGFQ